MSGHYIIAVFYCGAGLMFWPVFQLFHRRWNPRARRLFAVFLVTLAILVGHATLVIGPWKNQGAFVPILLLPMANLASLLVSTLVCQAKPDAPLPHSIRWIGITLAVLVCIPFCYTRFLLDWQGQPVCHKQLMMACEIWMDDHHTNAFPNVRGVGSDSLVELRKYHPGVNLERKYGYVAGLHKDDPGDLVLMYVNQPTRWIWHGVPRNIFAKKAWIVVPVDFTVQGGRDLTRPGECSETLPFDEFQVRLRRTIDFVRTNQRPNWETVVAEQTKFLNSIQRDSR